MKPQTEEQWLMVLAVIERLYAEVRAGNWDGLRQMLHGYATSPPEPSERQPDGYAYRYPDGCIRFSGGREINGSDPVESIPYYFRRAPEPGDQHASGWVIEGAWSPTNQPDYWVGSSAWSTDPYKALRFATQQSALQAAELMCSGVNVRICAHEWAEQPLTKSG